MTVYVAGRQAGKTVFLIQQSAKTGAVIMARYIDSMARDLGLQILPPIGFEACSPNAKAMIKPIWWTSCKWFCTS